MMREKGHRFQMQRPTRMYKSMRLSQTADMLKSECEHLQQLFPLASNNKQNIWLHEVQNVIYLILISCLLYKKLHSQSCGFTKYQLRSAGTLITHPVIHNDRTPARATSLKSFYYSKVTVDVRRHLEI